MKNQLAIVVIVGNEAEMIGDCLKSCSFASQVILVVTPSCRDATPKIAQTLRPDIKIIHIQDSPIDFSYWRNQGVKAVSAKWILFLDADERLTSSLQNEITTIINRPKDTYTNYDIPRANYFLGHRVKYGNSYPDYVKRLFLRSSFRKYVGQLHEQPQITGESSVVKSDLIHLTHRSLTTMLAKSLQWTPLEAKMIFETNHPPIVWWRIIRMMFTKLWQRLIQQQMWRDGTIGWISAIFETFDTFLIYSQVWEMQQNDN